MSTTEDRLQEVATMLVYLESEVPDDDYEAAIGDAIDAVKRAARSLHAASGGES